MTADPPPAPDPAVEAQATALIRLLEADGCIFHDEWYPEPGVAKLKYTRRSENHDPMWEIEVRPWVGWAAKDEARVTATLTATGNTDSGGQGPT